MSDMLAYEETYIQLSGQNNHFGGKIQVLVIISRVKLAIDEIFVGDK